MFAKRVVYPKFVVSWLWGLVTLPVLVAASGCDQETTDLLEGQAAGVLGECTTTRQCKDMYGPQATDCWNGGGGVCLCGTQECSELGDNDAPSVSFATPHDGDQVNADLGAVEVNASDDDGIANVKLYVDNQFVRQENVYPYRWNSSKDALLRGLSAGDHVLKAVAQDTTGATASAQITVTVAGSTPPSPSGWRWAYSSDGNQHDKDDWHASPMTLAVMYRAGFKNRLAHFDYNNHLGNNNASMAAEHRRRITTMATELGYDTSKFFDCQQNASAAMNHLAAAINASSASSPLILMCAGPMEVCYQGIKRAQASKRKYVVVISHSSWNDKHQDTSQMNHTWNDIQADFDVLDHHINDQNPPAFNSSCSSWRWLKNISGYGSTLYDLMCTGSKAGDASDAGMAYYVAKKKGAISGHRGTSNPSMSAVRRFFGQ